MESIEIDGVQIHLGTAVKLDMEWIGQPELLEQLLAAWAKIHADDLPLTPRILGPPGVGKTTLAYAAAKRVNKNVYILQCTADTRPEDLLITPVLGSNQEIKYHASPLVTAMIKGAVCILDEGNRMPEKSWASLAPLLDKRKYIESIIAGVKIKAHPDFRVCVTMNQDASVFEIPDYIGSRLQPKIHVPFPTKEEEMEVLSYNVPFSSKEIIEYVVDFLQKGHKNDETYSIRDGINILRYMLKLSKNETQPLPDEKIKEYFKTAAVKILDKSAIDYIEGRTPRKRIELPFGVQGNLIRLDRLGFLNQEDEDDEFMDDDPVHQEQDDDFDDEF